MYLIFLLVLAGTVLYFIIYAVSSIKDNKNSSNYNYKDKEEGAAEYRPPSGSGSVLSSCLVTLIICLILFFLLAYVAVAGM